MLVRDEESKGNWSLELEEISWKSSTACDQGRISTVFLFLPHITHMSLASDDLYDSAVAHRSLPSFLQIVNSTTPGASWTSGERYLDDVDTELHEESLGSFLAIKTGYIYLGGEYFSCVISVDLALTFFVDHFQAWVCSELHRFFKTSLPDNIRLEKSLLP